MTFIILIVAVFFLYVIIKGIATWSYNNSQPRITTNAIVVVKRTETGGGAGNHRVHTSYYVTFQFENGQRQEFQVKGDEFGQLVEGDKGILESQGTRYHGFLRQRVSSF